MESQNCWEPVIHEKEGVINAFVKEALDSLEERLTRTAEGASDEYMVKLEEEEYAKAVKILTDTYAECPHVKHIQDALDKPDFIWDSLFIENIGPDAVNKWYRNPLKADFQTFKKDNTIYDAENPYFSYIFKVVLYEKYAKILLDRIEQRKKKEQKVKRTYRKKSPAPRLCADDVMSRANLKRYQNTYAEVMQKYGLQRGIEGSEAQHISTHEYYRSLMAQGKDIQEDVEALLKQKERVEQELSKIKSEKKTEELKNTAAKTATTALKGINSLLGSNKISKLEKENDRLQAEITNRDDLIKKLQSDAEQQKEWHAEDIRYTKLQMQKTINVQERTINKILRWFPIVGEYLRIESECLMHGFSAEQTDKLVHGQALKFRGYLQADKRSPRVWAESVTAQIIRIAKDNLQLTVEQSPIIQWIQQQLVNKKRVTEDQETSNRRGFHL